MNAPPPQVLLVSMRSPLDPGHGDVAVLRARIAMLRAHARVTVLCFGPGGRVWPGDDGVRLVEVAPSRAGALRGMAWGLARGLPVQVGRCRQPALVAAFRALTAQTRFAAIGFVTLRPAFALEPDLRGPAGAALAGDDRPFVGEHARDRRARRRLAQARARLRGAPPGPAGGAGARTCSPPSIWSTPARPRAMRAFPICRCACPRRRSARRGRTRRPGAPLRVAVSGNFGYLPNREAALFAHEAVNVSRAKQCRAGAGRGWCCWGAGRPRWPPRWTPPPRPPNPPT
jgi:hypothetical protein